MLCRMNLLFLFFFWINSLYGFIITKSSNWYNNKLRKKEKISFTLTHPHTLSDTIFRSHIKMVVDAVAAMAMAMMVVVVVLLRPKLQQLTAFVFLRCLPHCFHSNELQWKFQFANTVHTIKCSIREKQNTIRVKAIFHIFF